MFRQPWQTVRDAISDLPRISAGQTSSKIANLFLNPGARSYLGHIGSPWDEPAKTLKAGDHGVPGGENTARLDDGSVRYFSVRECPPGHFPMTGCLKGRGPRACASSATPFQSILPRSSPANSPAYFKSKKVVAADTSLPPFSRDAKPYGVGQRRVPIGYSWFSLYRISP